MIENMNEFLFMIFNTFFIRKIFVFYVGINNESLISQFQSQIKNLTDLKSTLKLGKIKAGDINKEIEKILSCSKFIYTKNTSVFLEKYPQIASSSLLKTFVDEQYKMLVDAKIEDLEEIYETAGKMSDGK